MQYVLHILILIGIYVILSVSLDLIAGYTGMLSICHAAFFGIGAYVFALMAVHLNSPFLVNLICAVIISGLLGALIGLPTLRVRDDYFAMMTFAFQIIVFSILNNWVSLTGGPLGIPGIPQPSIFGMNISSHVAFLILVSILCVVVITAARTIVNSPFGRILKGIREDEIFVSAVGKNVSGYKITIFAIGAGMASIGGAIYAAYISFIDPTSFTIMESILILSILIIGGAGSIWGSIIGAIILISLPEIIRMYGIAGTSAGNIRQILYGGLLVVFMVWRPNGILGRYGFRKGNLPG